MKNFIQIALIIVLSVLLLKQCNVSAHLEKTYKNNIETSLDSIQFYKNAIGLEVAEKKAYKGTAKDLELFLKDEKQKSKQLQTALNKYKKLASVTKIETITEIKEVPVPFEVKVPLDFSRTFLKENEFYSIAGEVNQNGINFKSLSIPNTQTLVVGKKDIGFFKTEFRAEVTNSNPYVKTSSLDNFTFTENKKRFGIGFSFGFGVYSNGFFTGASVNYNLIQF